MSTESLNLEYNEDQLAIADAVRRFCENRCDTETVKALTHFHSADLWKELAAIGVLAPATPEGEGMGGALEICAVSEVLGTFVFPGPVAATYLALQVVNDYQRERLLDGSAIVSVSNKNDTLLPWAQHAEIFLQIDGKHVYAAEPDQLEVVITLGGEPWGRGQLKTTEQLQGAQRGLLLQTISASAFLCGAGLQLIKDASEYAAVRKQFGKTLGEFQAIAHPLADCQIQLTAAQLLTKAAASCFDDDNLKEAEYYASGAQLAANDAALQAAYKCHQVFAGIGITLEGPVFHISRRIRQLVSQPPGDTSAREQLLQHTGLGS